MPMQLIILSFSSNIIIMKYKWWWQLNYKEYTKIIIRFKVSEWFIPQYANQSSSLNSSAFDNESEQSTLNYFWKRDNFPYKPDRIYSTTLSTDVFSAIARDSLESSSNKANYLLGPQQKHKIWTKNNGLGIIVFKTSCQNWDYENKAKTIVLL